MAERTLLELCGILRTAGYRPYATMRIMGKELEVISMPFPQDDGLGIGCMVREKDDPSTMFEWRVPDHVITAAVEIYG